MFTDRLLESFSVDSSYVMQSNGLRVDANHYNPRVARALETLNRSGLKLDTLGNIVKDVFIPGRFARRYVEKEHGLPFLSGRHVAHFNPDDIKYISTTVHTKAAKWVIQENWILITRSGTVGRVALTPSQWNGWAASEHILRIVPDESGPCPVGYLYAYLRSPLGQAQLTAQIYGGVVDELTEGQTKSVLVPVPVSQKEKDEAQLIHETAVQSVRKRAEAMRLDDDCIATAAAFVPELERAAETHDDVDSFSRFQELAEKLLKVPKDAVVSKARRRG